jgi:hypothetical protein
VPGAQYVGAAQTLVPMPLFERVHARLDEHPYMRARELDLAFTGLITHGHCGGAVKAEVRNQKYVDYHCATRCHREAFVPEARMSALFADVVRRVSGDGWALYR